MNVLFDKARENFLTGKIDWMNGTIRAALCSHSKIKPDIANHSTLAEIGPCVVVKSPHFTSKSADMGVANASGLSFDHVPAGKRINSLIIYQEGASDTSSYLIAYIDDLGRGTFPFTANGGDVQIVWDKGPNKIFRI